MTKYGRKGETKKGEKKITALTEIWKKMPWTYSTATRKGKMEIKEKYQIKFVAKERRKQPHREEIGVERRKSRAWKQGKKEITRSLSYENSLRQDKKKKT